MAAALESTSVTLSECAGEWPKGASAIHAFGHERAPPAAGDRLAVARSPAEVRSELERLYTAHAEAVVRSVALASGSTAAAWDAVQDTFVTLYRKLENGLELHEEEGYLLRMARRKAQRRQSRYRTEAPISEDAAAESDVPAAATAGASVIWEACRRLNAAHRTAVLLHDVDGYSSDEIGNYLGTSRFSAAKLVKRGRAELLANLVQIIGRRAGCPPECAGRAGSIWSWISNELDFEAREHLREHVASCAFCKQTEDELRQARTYGVLPLLIPLAEVLRRKAQILATVDSRQVAARISWHPAVRLGAIAVPLTLLLIIGAIQVPARLVPPAALKPSSQPVAELESPSPSPLPSPTPSPSAIPSPIAKPTPAAAAPPDPCPTGILGGFAYLSAGRVMYRSSPGASPRVLDGTGRADDLRWTPNGSILVYKEAAGSGSPAGTLFALRPGQAPFWSFGSGILSFDISTDGSSVVALAPHFDASGTWDAWILFIGKLGSSLTPHVVAALVNAGGPNWSESAGAEPFVEQNYVPEPGLYEGVFWFGSTIYLADGGNFATFNTSGVETSGGYPPLTASVQALFASIGQPRGSAVHFTRRGVNLTTTCAGGTAPLVAAPHFTRYSSDTLMLCDDPINQRAGLAVEAYSGATGGDIYLVTADRRVIALTSDHHSYLPLWRP